MTESLGSAAINMDISVSPPLFRFTGALTDLDPQERAALRARNRESGGVVTTAALEAISRVRERGDDALRELAREYDRVTLERIEVPREAIERAAATLSPDVRTALLRAIANVGRAHHAWRPTASRIEVEPGIVLEHRPEALGRVGVYAPGGRAAYPSSVVMGVVPARVAGVSEIVLCSPPGPSGLPSAIVLAAAHLTGVDRVFALGGAGAVAALAYGTQSVPRVDRIVGPGNAYVTAAKRAVVDVVGTDTPAGPSELLIIADESADPDGIAHEMLAQAEHDPDASVVLVTTTAGLADAVRQVVDRLLPRVSRSEIIMTSFRQRGAVLLVDSLDDAIAFANEWAPEHLLLAVGDPRSLATRVRCAGTVCLGSTSSVVFGDYMTGANHVLPTDGAARYRSGLSTEDFVRWTTHQSVSPDAARTLSRDVAVLADAEKLYAHAATARRWMGRQ